MTFTSNILMKVYIKGKNSEIC